MTAGSHRRPKPRQRRAAARAALITVLLVLAALAAVGTELRLHGFREFIFRPPGTGATGGGDSAPAPAPDPAVTTYVVVVPPLQHARGARVTLAVTPGEHILIAAAVPAGLG